MQPHRDGGTDLAALIEINPPLAITTQRGPDAATIVLRPTTTLEPGSAYRFVLRRADGAVAASWAFQAKQPLNVVTTLPRNQATGVPVDTGIEIGFDQDGVTGASEHVSVRPAVAGRFEQHGRTLAFVPSRSLATGTRTSMASRCCPTPRPTLRSPFVLPSRPRTGWT